MQNFIAESAIYQEPKILKNEPKKAIFRMVMQTYDEVNQNKRIYPEKVLKEAMMNARERIDKKLPGEMDHPLVSGNEAFDGMRQTTVLLKEISHYIRDYEFSGNKLIGELETSSTRYGYDLLGMLKDKVVVGLSMRGIGEIESKGNVKVVQSPLYIITFDLVSLPSHKSAIVNFGEMKFESKNMLTESCSGTICLPNGVCFLPNYLDKLIESKCIKFFDRWV